MHKILTQIIQLWTIPYGRSDVKNQRALSGSLADYKGDSEAVGRNRALSGGLGGIVNSTSATLYIKWVVAGTPKEGCSSNPNISENDH